MSQDLTIAALARWPTHTSYPWAGALHPGAWSLQWCLDTGLWISLVVLGVVAWGIWKEGRDQ